MSFSSKPSVMIHLAEAARHVSKARYEGEANDVHEAALYAVHDAINNAVAVMTITPDIARRIAVESLAAEINE